ncbi:retrovirus-related pol polyprotein from transposon TNT 1-94 [Tanacetum coccineum]|uniref:Retrovirus-related pol polyprotein from transposon TNT 1-94 n=1 Tax=Tanacetum coccineum TaxID=301880 RepID=A0ABQ5FKE8_9ASTR
MLDKTMYNSWESRMLLYIKGKKNCRMMLESIKNGPLIYPTIEEEGQIQKKKYVELTKQERLQDDCDAQEKNIVFQGLDVLVFIPGDDPIAYLNKAMAFMSTIVASCFPSTNNQLRTSSNLRNQATIQDAKVNRNGGNTIAGQARVVKCYNCQGEGHMARQYALSQRGQGLQHNLRIIDCHDVQPTIIHNAAFQTDDPDAYDSDCDDISSTKAVLMANLSSYCLDVLSEVAQHDTYQIDMLNQSVQETQNFEQSLTDYVPDNEITSDSNIISYEQYLQQTQNTIVQDSNSFAQQDAMIMSVFEQLKIKALERKIAKRGKFSIDTNLFSRGSNSKGVDFRVTFPRYCVVYAFGISLSCSYTGNAHDGVLVFRGPLRRSVSLKVSRMCVQILASQYVASTILFKAHLLSSHLTPRFFWEVAVLK